MEERTFNITESPTQEDGKLRVNISTSAEADIDGPYYPTLELLESKYGIKEDSLEGYLPGDIIIMYALYWKSESNNLEGQNEVFVTESEVTSSEEDSSAYLLLIDLTEKKAQSISGVAYEGKADEPKSDKKRTGNTVSAPQKTQLANEKSLP